MKYNKFGLVAFFVMAIAVTGCAKKNNDQAGLNGAGFDSLSSSEELAQLPQASSSSTPVEALPIETSPVSQSASSITVPLPSPVDASSLTHEQQIQTALKNVGLYNGKIDGKLGPASKRAIEEFQRQNSLKVDGKVGPKTWAALEAHLASVGMSVPGTPVSGD